MTTSAHGESDALALLALASMDKAERSKEQTKPPQKTRGNTEDNASGGSRSDDPSDETGPSSGHSGADEKVDGEYSSGIQGDAAPEGGQKRARTEAPGGITLNAELKKAGRRRSQWKKYGEKVLKRKLSPDSTTTVNRCYYRCNFPDCPVKKQIEKHTDINGQTHKTSKVYGTHTHSEVFRDSKCYDEDEEPRPPTSAPMTTVPMFNGVGNTPLSVLNMLAPMQGMQPFSIDSATSAPQTGAQPAMPQGGVEQSAGATATSPATQSAQEDAVMLGMKMGMRMALQMMGQNPQAFGYPLPSVDTSLPRMAPETSAQLQATAASQLAAATPQHPTATAAAAAATAADTSPQRATPAPPAPGNVQIAVSSPTPIPPLDGAAAKNHGGDAGLLPPLKTALSECKVAGGIGSAPTLKPLI